MADILISMNKATDKLWKYADEWEKTPEHFDGVNPFCLAIHAVRQITNAPELLNEQKHGHWIPVKQPTGVEAFGYKEYTVQEVTCSECKFTEDVSASAYLYCPSCGAKMDEEVKQDGTQ